MPTADLTDGVFFIIGAPRSGTTLLAAILSAHPNLTVAPETEFFMKWRPPADPARRAPYLDRFLQSPRWRDQQLDDADFRRRALATDGSARSIFSLLLTLHSERTGKPRIGEKTPHHCRHVREIIADFPEARFIHIHRDPRDVAASLSRMAWSSGSPRSAVRQWAAIIDDHFALLSELPASTYLAVRYEALVTDPDGEVRRICDFLGEDFDPSMLVPRAREVVAPFSAREAGWKVGATEPITADSIGTYANSLSPRQVASIELTTGPQMHRLGYPILRHPGGRSRRPFGWLAGDFRDVLGDCLARIGQSVAKRFRRGG